MAFSRLVEHLNPHGTGRIALALHGDPGRGQFDLPLGIALQDVGIGITRLLGHVAVDDRDRLAGGEGRSGQHVDPFERGGIEALRLGVGHILDPENLTHRHHARCVHVKRDRLGLGRRRQKQQHRRHSGQPSEKSLHISFLYLAANLLISDHRAPFLRPLRPRNRGDEPPGTASAAAVDCNVPERAFSAFRPQK